MGNRATFWPLFLLNESTLPLLLSLPRAACPLSKHLGKMRLANMTRLFLLLMLLREGKHSTPFLAYHPCLDTALRCLVIPSRFVR